MTPAHFYSSLDLFPIGLAHCLFLTIPTPLDFQPFSWHPLGNFFWISHLYKRCALSSCLAILTLATGFLCHIIRWSNQNFCCDWCSSQPVETLCHRCSQFFLLKTCVNMGLFDRGLCLVFGSDQWVIPLPWNVKLLPNCALLFLSSNQPLSWILGVGVAGHHLLKCTCPDVFTLGEDAYFWPTHGWCKLRFD